MAEHAPERLLTREEVAERLGLAPITVADKLRAGELPGVHVGRLWRVREADLDAYVRDLAAAAADAREGRRRKAQRARAKVRARAKAARALAREAQAAPPGAAAARADEKAAP